jgi:hypothetical protein
VNYSFRLIGRQLKSAAVNPTGGVLSHIRDVSDVLLVITYLLLFGFPYVPVRE